MSGVGNRSFDKLSKSRFKSQNKRRDRRNYSKSADRSRIENTPQRVMRGGYRL